MWVKFPTMKSGFGRAGWARCCFVSLVGTMAVWWAQPLAAATARAPAAMSLAAVDYAPASPGTAAKLLLALPSRPEFKAFTLDGPARLVIDLSGTRSGDQLDLSKVSRLTDAMPLRGLRVAPRGDTLRVVVDLAQPTAYEVRWRTGKGGLVAALEVVLGAPLPAATTPDPVPVQAPPAVRTTAAPVVAANSPASREAAVGRDLVIAIDAGHGGKDPGAIGARGTREKDVTLAVARRLAAVVDAEPGLKAYLVRDGDYFVELRQRMVRARKAGADLFVSIHADSAPNRAAAGSSVFILSTRGASSEAARWLADRENSADLAGGVQLDKVDPTVASVLMDLSQGDTITSSDRAARRVLEELDRIGNIHNREVQSAGFVVLKSPDIPSMLVETAFISHPAEEDRLGNPEHQQRLADAIHDGLRDYFHANPPPGTRIAQLVAANRRASRLTAAVQ